MKDSSDSLLQLPSAQDIHRAIDIYLACAFSRGSVPESVLEIVPPDGFDVAEFLMGPHIEKTPSDASLASARSFALRLGNRKYRHMKLRLTKPSKERYFIFSVDSHDAFLSADRNSPDRDALEELKRNNAKITADITTRWDAAGLPTERNYLRLKIQQAKNIP